MTASVSIIIPTYNRVEYLPDAVASVLDQAVEGAEVIVVDDGSTDGTQQALEGFGAAIRVLRQDNAGPSAARNTGVGAASGELLAFLDSDDLCLPGSLAHRMQVLSGSPSVDLVVGRSQLIVESVEPGRQVEPGRHEARWTPVGPPLESRMLGATLVRRAAFDRVGSFDERLRFGEDEDWFMRADERSMPIVVEDTIYQHCRRHESNMTHDHAARRLALLQLVKYRRDRGAAVPD